MIEPSNFKLFILVGNLRNCEKGGKGNAAKHNKVKHQALSYYGLTNEKAEVHTFSSPYRKRVKQVKRTLEDTNELPPSHHALIKNSRNFCFLLGNLETALLSGQHPRYSTVPISIMDISKIKILLPPFHWYALCQLSLTPSSFQLSH